MEGEPPPTDEEEEDRFFNRTRGESECFVGT